MQKVTVKQVKRPVLYSAFFICAIYQATMPLPGYVANTKAPTFPVLLSRHFQPQPEDAVELVNRNACDCIAYSGLLSPKFLMH